MQTTKLRHPHPLVLLSPTENRARDLLRHNAAVSTSPQRRGFNRFWGRGSACRLGPPTSPDSSACLRLAFQRNCNRKKLERGSRSDGGQRRKAFRLGLDDPGNSLPPLHSKSHLGVLRGRAKGNSRLLFDFFTWWFLPSSRDVTVSRAFPSPLHTASVARAIYSPQLPSSRLPPSTGQKK